ncbi:MAG: 3-deoxy-D-manno-octulosonic acid transferase [Deferribacteres bacterium]|nr:3-deoxy-D-manno-octulosonic acid transferase [Deferribacteres bacterium]
MSGRLKESAFLSLYNLLFALGAGAGLPFIAYKMVRQEKYRAGLSEKLGLRLPEVRGEKRIWIHAVSVGEVLAVVPLVKGLKRSVPHASLILSTTTQTGMRTARDRLKDEVDTFLYFPLDFYPVVSRVVRAVSPHVVGVVETEIWPSFLSVLASEGVPVFMINGRISDASFRGYEKLSFFLKPFFEKYRKFFVRSCRDAARLYTLGASPQKIAVTGNIKYVSVYERAKEVDSSAVMASLGWEGFPIFCAGSTHRGEEELVLEVYKRVRELFSDLKLILAPRHPERKEEVARLLEASSFSFGFRSEGNYRDKDVMVVDTVGELFGFYSVSDVVFVGGSFVNVGGHNPLEPLVFGKPTAIGPHYHNFADVVEDMRELLFVAESRGELLEFVLKSLNGSFKLPLDKVMKKFNLSINSVRLIIDEIKGCLE